MRLRWRLALVFAAATAAVIAVAGVVFVLQLRVSVEASLDPGLRARAAEVADDITGEGGWVATPGHQEIVQTLTVDGRVRSTTPNAGSAPLLDRVHRDEALAGETTFTQTVSGDRVRLLATTVQAADGRTLVVVGTGTDVSDAAVDRAVRALVLGGPPAVLLAGLSAFLLAGAVLRPVERMRRTAADISDRNLDVRLAVPATRDEIAALGTTINALLTRLQDALARERGFVADAGHELRTPLAILRAELELAGRPGRSRSELVDAVQQAGEETDRLSRLTEDLLLLARADNRQPFLRRTHIEVATVVTAAVRGARISAAGKDVTVRMPERGSGSPAAPIDPDRLRQAIDNVLDNAIRHAPDHGTVDVVIDTEGPDVRISVADDGAGFPVAFLPRAFERFHRADSARDRAGGGAGLGLSIVRAIVEAHGGRVRAANRSGGGAIVVIDLPRSVPNEPVATADDDARPVVR